MVFLSKWERIRICQRGDQYQVMPSVLTQTDVMGFLTARPTLGSQGVNLPGVVAGIRLLGRPAFIAVHTACLPRIFSNLPLEISGQFTILDSVE
jgi:hypothetical protein